MHVTNLDVIRNYQRNHGLNAARLMGRINRSIYIYIYNKEKEGLARESAS
jgi:hypothetical protein